MASNCKPSKGCEQLKLTDSWRPLKLELETAGQSIIADDHSAPAVALIGDA